MSLTKEDIYIENELLSGHTSFRIGGPARIWAEPRDIDELKKIIADIAGKGIDYRIIGNGSNILAGDAGVPWAVIKLSNFNKISIEGNLLKAQGGVCLNELTGFLVRNNMAGLEFIAGIPGTVGGAVKTNAGAFGSETADVLSEIEVLDGGGKIFVLKRKEIDFGYRHSNIGSDKIILSAKFSVKKSTKENIRNKVNEIAGIRKDKIPYSFPSAGSIFKNPEGCSAGEIIDRLGIKGLSCRRAMVSSKHANVIINLGGARADDIKKLINYIKNRAYAETGIKLETEIEYW